MDTTTISPPSATAPAAASAPPAPAAAPASAPTATAAAPSGGAGGAGTVPAPQAGSAAAPPPTTVEGVDIKRVISGSTSEVALADLSKKGFKQVKVLNQATIIKLIGQAVDQVMKKRSTKMTDAERNKVIEESAGKFEALAKEKVQRERNRISELERANEALLKETEDLRTQIDRFRSAAPAPAPVLDHQALMESLVSRLQGMAGPGANTDKLEKSMQMIMERIEKLPRGQGGVEYVDKDIIIDALFRHDVGGDTESNIDKVKVKEEKAGGVKDTLAKLKALQKKE